MSRNSTSANSRSPAKCNHYRLHKMMIRILLVVLNLMTCFLASSVVGESDGQSNAPACSDDLMDGSCVPGSSDEYDHDESRHDGEFRNVWVESRMRMEKLKSLQEQFADVEVMLTDQVGIIRRHLAWKHSSMLTPDHHDKLDTSASGINHVTTHKDIPKPGGRPDRVGNRRGIGALYIKWGETTCPHTAMTVYDGTVGGAWSLKRGEEVDSQCLPNTPSFPVLESDIHLHPGEEDDVFKNSRGEKVPNISHETPCVVCRVTFRPTVRMLIDRTTCTTPDWTLEYTGALMTSLGSDGNDPQFICVVIRKEESTDNIIADDIRSGIQRFKVDGNSGENQRTCAVCTK